MQRAVRTVETLPCILTDEEKIKKSQDMCAALEKVDELETDLDGIKKKYKGMIEEQNHIAMSLRTQVSTGKEYKEIECRIEWDFDSKKKGYFRTDTGEFVRDVPISEHECQEYNAELAEEEERLKKQKDKKKKCLI